MRRGDERSIARVFELDLHADFGVSAHEFRLGSGLLQREKAREGRRAVPGGVRAGEEEFARDAAFEFGGEDRLARGRALVGLGAAKRATGGGTSAATGRAREPRRRARLDRTLRRAGDGVASVASVASVAAPRAASAGASAAAHLGGRRSAPEGFVGVGGGGGALGESRETREDGSVAGASAQVAADRLLDLGAGGSPRARTQEGVHGHDKTWGAEAALRAVRLRDRSLHGVEAGAPRAEALDRDDVRALARVQREEAGVDGAVVHLPGVVRGDHHSARAATALAAAELCAGET